MTTTDFRSLIQTDGARRQIEDALPSHMTADNQVRALLTALNKTPKLLNCTRTSFIQAMMDCSHCGLVPDGRQAHLIPYGNNCTLVIGYQGLVEMAYRSGHVTNVETGVVHEGDKFDYEKGKHTPHGWRLDSRKPKEQGKPIGAYCFVSLKDGMVHRERMTVDEINVIRDRSKAGKSGPWQTDWSEMARKTVFRRASKWIPLSAEMHNALSRDGDSRPPLEEEPTEFVASEPILSTTAAIQQRVEALHQTPQDAPEPPQEVPEQEQTLEQPERLTQADRVAAWQKRLNNSDDHAIFIARLAEMDADEELTDHSRGKLAKLASALLENYKEEQPQ